MREMYFHLYVLDNLIMMMFVAELVHAFLVLWADGLI